jgi:hypothetical protein
VQGVRIPVSPEGGFFILASLTIDILRQACIALVEGFTISSDAVMADVVDPAPKSRQESRAGGDGLSGALRLLIRAFL